MDNENILTNGQVTEIIDLVEKTMTDEYMLKSQKEWTVLKDAAIIFINRYNELTKKKIVQETQTVRKLIHGDPANPSYVPAYQASQNIVFSIKQQQYLAAFEFDYALTKFRGSLPRKAIFVVDDENHIPTSFELSLEQLVQLANKRGRLFNVSSDKLKTLTGDSSKESKMIQVQHVQQAKNAYMGTMNRLDRYFEKRRESGNNSQERNAILLWKTGKAWTLARVLNRGDVKEAYVAALLREHGSKLDFLCNISSASASDGNPKYQSHELIESFFNNYIAKVTNMAAIREEDVITATQQYAVKGEAASLPSIKQYLKVANFIKNTNSILSRAEIESQLEEMFPQNAVRNKIITTTNDIANLAYKELGLSNTEYEAVVNISTIF